MPVKPLNLLVVIMTFVACLSAVAAPPLTHAELEALANKGDASAQVDLAWRYREGVDVKQDYVKALKYYQLAAEQGNAVALSNLGFFYLDGTGVEKDLVKAQAYFKKGCEKDDMDACSGLEEFNQD